MTVNELIDRIIAAYPGASAEAMATFKPVFAARFQKREGPHLAAAFSETLARFKPTGRQPFPIPANIEEHMPSLPKSDAKDYGPPIREALERRSNRSRVLINDWLTGQGAKIKQSRVGPLYAACLLEVMDEAKRKALDERVAGIRLGQAKINECYQRAISNERRKRYGPPERCTPTQWWEQIIAIAAEWHIEITPGWWSKETGDTLNPKAEAA